MVAKEAAGFDQMGEDGNYKVKHIKQDNIYELRDQVQGVIGSIHPKLVKLKEKAELCVSRDQAQEIIRKAEKAQRKIQRAQTEA